MEREPKEDAYQTVLEDLEKRKEEIETAISSIKILMGQSIEPPAARTSETIKSLPGKIESDTFFGLGLIDAAKKYLAIVKRPQSGVEIAKALLSGGFNSTSKNFNNTVQSVISRHSTNVKEIIRVQKKWGLAEWYRGRKKIATGNKAEVNGEDSTEDGATKDETLED